MTLTRIDIPLLLPDVGALRRRTARTTLRGVRACVADVRDQCIARLTSSLEARDGVERVHVLDVGEAERPGEQPVGQPVLCLHYDPELQSLERLKAIALAAGAEITGQFSHAMLPLRAIATEDAGRRIEEVLQAQAGITSASVSLAGQVARIEFDTRVITRGSIEMLL